MKKTVVLITCSDQKGLISKISNCFLNADLNIHNLKEFVEEETNIFFMRSEVLGELDSVQLYLDLKNVLPFDAVVYLNPKEKKDIVILATKEYHCMSDLLVRHHFGEINANIKAIVCNHPHFKDYISKFNIPLIYVTHDGKSKQQFENEILEAIKPYNADYLILAKFMRILSSDFVSHYENKIINIHHSFLPAFIGANPYKQAFERGVKLIGATAHIVNNDLDEGPILVQEVIKVDHSFTVKKLVQAGHELERNALAKACQLVFEDRVFVSGNKTIIFD